MPTPRTTVPRGLGWCAGRWGRGIAGRPLRSGHPCHRDTSRWCEFTQPEVLESAGGRLAVTLVAAPSQVAFGSGKRFAYTYNGTTPGPTLRVRPGDALSITVVNRLGESTNLHTHGLHVSPSGRPTTSSSRSPTVVGTPTCMRSRAIIAAARSGSPAHARDGRTPSVRRPRPSHHRGGRARSASPTRDRDRADPGTE